MTKQTELDAKTGPIMATITQTVIDAMKAGTAPWQKPWISRGHDTPTNLQTGAAYRGLNSFYLMLLGAAYDCNYWVGFKQARKIKGNVRKGEKSTAILAPIMRKGEDSNGDKYMYPAGFRVVRVFNAMQCDGLTIPTAADFEPRVIDADALDAFAINTGANIEHGQTDQACFVPSQDLVRMPAKDQFSEAGGYYGTLLHELTHWTGHKSRLNRIKSQQAARRDYAFEELIAELGAYYASERLGCPNEAENHASYLQSWLKALENDPKYLWQAASAAERAANYLIECADKGASKKAA